MKKGRLEQVLDPNDTSAEGARSYRNKRRSSADRLPPVRSRSAALPVTIGKHVLVCVNALIKIALRLDRGTIDFLTDHMVALVNRLSEDVKSGVSSTPRSVGKKASFHIRMSDTPNIRDRVSWSVQKSSWVCLWKLVSKDNGTEKKKTMFPVDMNLDPEKFKEEQVRQYECAKDWWNNNDGSTRDRIPAKD